MVDFYFRPDHRAPGPEEPQGQGRRRRPAAAADQGDRQPGRPGALCRAPVVAWCRSMSGCWPPGCGGCAARPLASAARGSTGRQRFRNAGRRTPRTIAWCRSSAARSIAERDGRAESGRLSGPGQPRDLFVAGDRLSPEDSASTCRRSWRAWTRPCIRGWSAWPAVAAAMPEPTEDDMRERGDGRGCQGAAGRAQGPAAADQLRAARPGDWWPTRPRPPSSTRASGRSGRRSASFRENCRRELSSGGGAPPE